ncbi:low specificity L-threonine aldolase [Reinekea marina]|uniref:L-threonine aldolase n=1 Tax=Reinekea marina TaxID=1310421 RepID=A0ABV7WQ36_9GAMM|nr:low specificity L-threonine aldolase [Reinekea marina]MDN3650712.1 low specificity L-threonine aldolase [Reinekea marina]
MYFGSDNQTGASPQVLNAIIEANNAVTDAYGEDQWTQQACAKISEIFECDADVFLVNTGTAANSLALACMVDPWSSIICHGQAHIINDELTAPEFFTHGARLIGLDTQEAQLSAQSLSSYLSQGAAHPPHNAEPKALSITQASESGMVYSVEQVTELAKVAHQHGLTVHMDGARFTNALVNQKCTPAELTWKAGVDVLCLGATKNGALAAEAVVFFNKDLAKSFVARRKRSGHLLSKGRLYGAQICGWLENDHWIELAAHANQQASKLAAGIEAAQSTRLVWPTMANEVFAILPNQTIEKLRTAGAVLYEWIPGFLPRDLAIEKDESVVRLVCSFRTQDEEVAQFIEHLS